MEAAQVNEAFAEAERRYNRTECRDCRGCSTFALINMGVIVVSCQDCGGATRKGRLVQPATA
ncbi:hypothetical protein [Streptomyces lunaelactis]|uniref:hypothetical protein n=1 Tax=Streptomyces lunaelactis TaxID=1535768 RepID=UPI00158568CD|nr:hypothetical protein [Streptomyces lunaelactis]NUK22086.1 hypothetical protein [Streptomyces lunaelactis]